MHAFGQEYVKEANLFLLIVSLLQVGKHVMKACGGNASSPFNIISPCKLASEIQNAQVSFGQMQCLQQEGFLQISI